MKRRKWWIIGITVGLLAACVGVWKWSERPPYAFMGEAKLYFVEDRDDWNPRTVVTYTSMRPFAQVRNRAIAELGKPSVDSKAQLKFVNVLVLPAEQWDVNSTTDSAYPGPPKGAQSIIRISREPTTADKVRALWLQGWHPGGTEP